jgi:exopolysaccharide biosynthesis polyprenyl glycosylphosphotransferase
MRATAAGGTTAGRLGPVQADARTGGAQAAAWAAAPGRAGGGVIRLLSRALVGLPASTWLLLDALLMTGWIIAGFELVPPFVSDTTPHIALWQACAVLSFAVMVSSLIFGLYERETLLSQSRLMTRMGLAIGATCLIAYGIIYVVMYSTISRRIAGLSLVAFLITSLGLRLLAYREINKVHRGLIVVGTRALFESFRLARSQGFLSEYRLPGYVTIEPACEQTQRDPSYLGTIHDVIGRLSEWSVTDVVVGAEAANDPDVMKWIVPCFQHGCRVTNEAIFYEKATGQILVDEITPYWFLFADLKVYCDEHATMKRVIDLVVSLVGLCLSAPLWPLIALIVKLGDGGPVFYWQDRVGQNGQIFRLYKFRTMKVNAESGQSVWASPDDPRVTRVGRLLRRSRLDELPQLYNILMGDMSVVGPRPERPDIVVDLCRQLPYYAERHLVKPGLTGWAQISFRYGSSIEDSKRKLQFDLYYLKHMSFELDAMIILRTIGTFLKGGC